MCLAQGDAVEMSNGTAIVTVTKCNFPKPQCNGGCPSIMEGLVVSRVGALDLCPQSQHGEGAPSSWGTLCQDPIYSLSRAEASSCPYSWLYWA